MTTKRPLTAEARNTRARLAAVTQKAARTAKAAQAADRLARAADPADADTADLLARVELTSRAASAAEQELARLRTEWDAERWLSAVVEAVGATRPALSADQSARLSAALSAAGLLS